jgi:cyclopropane fatty-acyl-phospholipid synthase-like methyltransferase
MADKKFDLNEIFAEYGEDDFGFTATDEAEYNSVIAIDVLEHLQDMKSGLKKIYSCLKKKGLKLAHNHTGISVCE